MQKSTYVIIASGHNIPALESCLDSQCEDALIIATSQTADAARVLKSALEQRRLAVQVLDGMGGEDIAECQRWIHEQLHPILKKLQGPVWLNLNGGTKPMALLLATCWPWHGIDYQAYALAGDAPVQRFSLNLPCHPESDAIILQPSGQRQKPLSPIEILQTYGKVKAEDPKPNVGDYALAQELLAIHQSRKGHPWWAIEAMCGKHWDDSNKNQRSERIEFSSLQSALQTFETTQDELVQWLNRTATVLGHDFWQHDDTHMSLPSSKHKSVKWLAGQWLEHWAIGTLEQYCQTHPQGANLQFAANVKVTAGETNQREIDVASRDGHGHLLILELKVDIPYGAALKDYQNSLESLSNHHIGKGNMGLGVTPAFFLNKENMKEGKKETFEKRCHEKRIKLIELTGPESLLAWLAPSSAATR